MMKIVKLTLHWDADEAITALDLIDRLREQIADEYGDAIAEQMRHADRTSIADIRQLALPFVEQAPF